MGPIAGLYCYATEDYQSSGVGCGSRHAETPDASSMMLVRPRMQGWPISLPTGHARCCSTPQAAVPVSSVA